MVCRNILFSLFSLLPYCLGVATNDDCRTFTVLPTACDSTSSYIPCQYNANSGALELSNHEPVQCNPPYNTCYKESREFEPPISPCGLPPPVCSDEGTFALRRRGCATYYSCVSDGNESPSYQQVISTCEKGFEFSEITKRCELAAEAGCSVPSLNDSCRLFMSCDDNHKKFVSFQCPWRHKDENLQTFFSRECQLT